jgi:two-component system response regulator AtoC
MSAHRPSASTHTAPIVDGELFASRQDSPGGPRVALLVLHATEPRIAVLSPGRPVVVGRKSPSDVTLSDPSLSRAHARFTLEGDPHAVFVEDLGSTNGTWIAGERIESARVAVGEAVRLGGVPVQIEAFQGPDSAPWPPRPSGHDTLLVAGAAMRPLLERVPLLAASSVAVLLHGETGTGKEVITRLLHESGPRRGKPLVRVNCGAIPRELVESTLFGHEKGAFTGALQQKKGVFEEADGGTVMLDEIGELPAPAQVALLRVLETRSFARVGSNREIGVDVRVVAATHRDLVAMSKAGQFRLDLYYRLATVVLEIPPLRARRDEIEPLAMRFLAEAAKANGRRLRGIGEDALALLEGHDFPGNIRELKNAIEHAAVFARGDRIGDEDLPEWLRSGAPPRESARAPAARPKTRAVRRDERASRPEAGRSQAARGHLKAYEAQVIREALEASGWRRREAAERLGMPLRTLAYRIKVLGITRGQA